MERKLKNKDNSIHILLALFILICSIYLIRFVFFKIDTEIVKYHESENSIAVNGVIIRKELVTTIPQNSKLKYSIEEGEKVGFGKKIVEIIKGENIDDNISVKLNELNSRIDQIKTEKVDNNLFQQDVQKLNANIKDRAIEIKNISKSGNYTNIESAKTDLIRYLYKRSIIEGDGSFYGKNIDELEKQKAELDKIYNESINTIYAETSGIVSYELDGFESILDPNKINNLGINELENIIKKLNDKNQIDDDKLTGVKIVDNMEWYVACAVDKTFTEGLKKGNKVSLRFKKIGNEEVDAYVSNISNTEDKLSVITFKVNHNIDEFYKHRYLEIDIIKNQYKGFMVPTKSLTEKNGQNGIYIVRSGVVRFVPIKILLTDSSNSLIVNDDSKEAEEINQGSYQVKQFDEVIVTTKRVKENQFIIDNQ